MAHQLEQRRAGGRGLGGELRGRSDGRFLLGVAAHALVVVAVRVLAVVDGVEMDGVNIAAEAAFTDRACEATAHAVRKRRVYYLRVGEDHPVLVF